MPNDCWIQILRDLFVSLITVVGHVLFTTSATKAESKSLLRGSAVAAVEKLRET
jgi:hypothetical protein